MLMIDSRIAVVGYKDPTTNTFLSFTDQPKIEDRKTAALQAINSISVGGGGDIPEYVNSGLIRALSGVQVHGEKKRMQDESSYLAMHQPKIPSFLIRSFN
jgi:hypothetical protein